LVAFPNGELDLTVRFTPEAFLVDDAQISFPRSRVQGAGSLSRSAGRPSHARLLGTVDLEALRELPFVTLPALAAWQLTGIGEGELQWQGRPDDLAGSAWRARLQTERLTVRGLPLEALTATAEQADRTLRVQLPAALLASGKLWGELAMRYRPGGTEYLLQADLVNTDLAQVAQLVPAWRSRTVTGSASIHLLLSGVWEQRATWLGEGWLNAAGQGLGDVPLLDKLFRGFFGVLADRIGFEPLRRGEITQVALTWRLAEERFRTSDVRLGGTAGGEPIAIYAQGSVGWDRTIDFVVEPALSESLLPQSPPSPSLAGAVLKAAGRLEQLRQLIGRHRLTGTLDQPHYRFEATPANLIQNLFDAVR
jgi:hypothetical protein